MSSVAGQPVDEAVAEMVAALTPHAHADWQARAGSLEWSCWTTAAHVAHDSAAYAGQVAGRSDAEGFAAMAVAEVLVRWG